MIMNGNDNENDNDNGDNVNNDNNKHAHTYTHIHIYMYIYIQSLFPPANICVIFDEFLDYTKTATMFDEPAERASDSNINKDKMKRGFG